MSEENSKPRPGYSALRRFRSSLSESDYFLTINAARPASRLAAEPLLTAIRHEVQRCDGAGFWRARSYVVMPDHLHLLVTLGADYPLSEVVRRLKGRLAPNLRKLDTSWQAGFYDHRLRQEEDVLPVFLYIFLNPHRAGLLPANERWPGYYCDEEDWRWFKDWTRDSAPYPEWLR